MTVEQGWDYTNEHDRKVAVDEQGRLRVVDESGGTGGGGGGDVVITDPATANQATVDASGNLHVAVAEPVTVDGVQTDALTDAELRAAPVPVSGTVSVTEPVSVDDNGGSLTVDGPLTDAELRAAPVEVTGARPDLGDTGYDGATLGTNRVTITANGSLPGAGYTVAANPNRKYLSVYWSVDPSNIDNPASPFGADAALVYLLGSGAAWFIPAHIYTGLMYPGDMLIVPEGYKGPVSFSSTMLTSGVDVSLQITEF
jgi:hypothetical protein